MNTHRTTKLIGLFLLGLVLFNFPVILQFSTPYLIFDLPTLFSYIFVTWFVLILGVARISEGLDKSSKKESEPTIKSKKYE